MKIQARTKLYAYNLALKRQDGKIEQDTVYRVEPFKADDIKDMGTKFSCSVFVSFAGFLTTPTKIQVQENSFFFELPEPVKVDDKGGVNE